MIKAVDVFERISAMINDSNQKFIDRTYSREVFRVPLISVILIVFVLG